MKSYDGILQKEIELIQLVGKAFFIEMHQSGK